ncbi:MAG: NAD(+) synthase [Holophagaceae bacterium]
MQIALLQLDARLGDPEGNARRIEAAYADAVGKGAELVLAPELAVPGYLAEDRLWEPGLRARVEAESRRLAALSGSVPLLFGTSSPAPSGRLWNELWWCEAGERKHVIRKRALPEYDVFDEARWFEASTEVQPLIDFGGQRLGISICEDLWADPSLSNAPVTYAADPISDLARKGATLILNASASPGNLGSWVPPGKSAPWAVPSKAQQRRRLIAGLAAKHGIPVVYASRVGAESWLLFDGGSGLAQPDGSWQDGPEFVEATLIVDTEAPGTRWPEDLAEGDWLRQALVMGIRGNAKKQGVEGFVLGLSGGIDSAVAAALAAEAMGPDKVLAVALPTRFSSAESLELAKDQAARLGVGLLEVNADLPFTGAAEALKAALPGRAFSLTDENLQSRSRAMLLMALTSEPGIHAKLGKKRLAVLNTGNKSEAATGYFTLYGDGIGAFGPLADCLKARIYALARHYGEAITPGILHRVPTAELKPGQTDEASLLPYGQLDAILGAAIEAQRPEEGLADDLACFLDGDALANARANLPRILGLLRATEFKRRQLPYGLKVSPKAFGAGRRIPLTAI